jgi:hypothetical protein
MKNFIVVVIILTFALVNGSPLTITADVATVTSNAWSYWSKDGTWKYTNNDNSNVEVDWVQKCSSISPHDIYFSLNDQRFARTDGKLFTIGNKIIFRDDKNNQIGYMREDITTKLLSTSVYSIYYIYDANNNLVGTSDKLELFSTDINIYDGSTLIATTTQSFVNKNLQKLFMNGKLIVTFKTNTTWLTNYDNRYLLLMATSTKAIADLQRDSKGNVSHSTCQSVYLFLIIGLPLITVALICLCCCVCYKKCGRSFRCSKYTDL